ncbi:MAG: alkaline phosphatase PhoX [Segetibacter sp.]
MKTSIYQFFLPFVFLCTITRSHSQAIGTFSSVTPSAQTQSFVLPSTHTFQRIIKSGDVLDDATTLGINLDFTGYVPITGSSSNGYLSISTEANPAKVAIMNVAYNFTTHTWAKSNSGNVAFSTGPESHLGAVRSFCSGTVTPNGTIIVGEETTAAGNANPTVDEYEDLGWLIEINPATKQVMDYNSDGIQDKLWAAGRQAHENTVIKSDNTIMYWGADHSTNGFVYKFVPSVPGNFSSGTLSVLNTTAGLGTGTWVIIPNGTVAERNNTVGASIAAGAFNFNGIEDVEIGNDGMIYFAAKAAGRVYRFRDLGSTVDMLSVFVENTTYDVDPGPAVVNEAWGVGNDNLAFDGEGNLWVLQDGDRNHIWVVGPTHTAASPQVRLFATTPAGSEPTGITFTPDFKFMFLSFQHPSVSNSAAQTDASGASVVFNTHTTVVVARTENLGPAATLPLKFTGFNVKAINQEIHVSWSVSDVQNHANFVIERSVNGNDFQAISTNNQLLGNGINDVFNFIDRQAPSANVLFYRIKQCDIDGSCRYTEVRSVKVMNIKGISVYPVPAYNNINVEFHATKETTLIISLMNRLGQIVVRETKKVSAGVNKIPISIQQLPKGNYTISIDDGKSKQHEKFLKL